MRIIIFDGSFKTTSFINRLAAGLAATHTVFIAGFNDNMSRPVPRVHYIPLGSNQNKKRFIQTAFYWAFKTRSLKAVSGVIKALIKGDRKAIQNQNLAIALDHIQPDIIHLQWTSVIKPFEEILKGQQIPIILSQRGFHTNVKPFVYPKNMEYLSKWYPYFAGFHSVSNAITRNSDKIWKGTGKIDRVVYTGLPLEKWPFLKEYKKTNKLELLSVGRSHWKKGYDYGLRVCASLKKMGVSFQYTIIGAAGEEELQFLRHDLGIEDEVFLLDKIPVEKVKNFMRSSTLMLLPSLEEGLPNVAVEAMAIGLPVIAFDVDGLPELIDNGKEGWLVKAREVEGMAEAVMAFSKLPLEEIEKVRVAARKKVELQHNEEQMVRGMEELYEKVIAAHKQKINNHEEHEEGTGHTKV